MMFLKRLLKAIGLIELPPCRIARQALRNDYPTYMPIGTRLRATEPRRYVVAVFYKEPEIVHRPSPYKLYEVSPDLTTATEVPCNPESPYWIQDRK
jgi:hypothetical protein